MKILLFEWFVAFNRRVHSLHENSPDQFRSEKSCFFNEKSCSRRGNRFVRATNVPAGLPEPAEPTRTDADRPGAAGASRSWFWRPKQVFSRCRGCFTFSCRLGRFSSTDRLLTASQSCLHPFWTLGRSDGLSRHHSQLVLEFSIVSSRFRLEGERHF